MNERTTDLTAKPENEEAFLRGGGEMGALMRAFDWSKTSLGPVSHWPQSLKTVVRIMLTSRFAMWMGWGDELIFFYNDAYKPTLGVKHPWALGASAREVWAEIWQDIGPRIESVLQTGKATWDEALLLYLERNGYSEETYHTFSYSPLSTDQPLDNDKNDIVGMLCVVTEETKRVIGERRMALLREIATRFAAAQTQDDIFTAFKSCIEAGQRDLPCTLTYLFESCKLETNEHSVRLVCATGLPIADGSASPLTRIDQWSTSSPLQKIKEQSAPALIENFWEFFDPCSSGNKSDSLQQAIIVPLAQQGQEQPSGFFVTAVNPNRRPDQAYLGFVGLLAGQIAARLASVSAYEDERKRAEALAEIDRAKTTFFSNVSHELRTPLTLMLGPVEDMLASSDDKALPQNRDLLMLVQRNGHRLLKLVNTLLDFSRIEAGRVQARYEPVDLSEVTTDIASAFRSAAERAGLTFLVDCPPLPQPVYIDREMWEKIVLNLLSNAIKFTLDGELIVSLRAQPGGSLEATGQQKTEVEKTEAEKSRQAGSSSAGVSRGWNAVLTVKDTGVGILETELAHIFDRFHRVEESRGRSHEGTGIGLALVQELVHLHHGSVAVHSAVEKGTTFTVTIPFGTAHLPQDRLFASRTLSSTASRAGAYVEEALGWQPEREESTFPLSPLTDFDSKSVSKNAQLSGDMQSDADRTSRPRIVLADDNIDMRRYVRRLLQEHYEVEAVTDGQEALAAVQRQRPDLVLSDVMMPRLDGFGLLRALRSRSETNTIPIILLSARAGEEATVEGLEAGADDYLIKPFSAKELLAVVKSHLQLARVRLEVERELRERQEEIQALNVRLQRSIRETHHRVKNNLQFTAAMVDMQVMEQSRPPSVEDFKHLGSQIRTLAAVHDLLTAQATEGSDISVVSAKKLLQQLLTMLQQGAQGKTLSYTLEDCNLPGKKANSLALLVNELVSNGMKHGKGNVTVDLKINLINLTGRQSRACLTVSDNGLGFPAGFDPDIAAHTGLTLVDSLVRMDLQGTVCYNNCPEGGGQVQVEFPVEAD